MFERFTKTGKSFKTRVTIQRSSIIAPNLAATVAFKFEDYKFAILFFDPSIKRVGIRLTNSETEDGIIKVRIREKVGALLSAQSFLDYYKLHDYAGKTFDATWDSKEKMVVFDLKK